MTDMQIGPGHVFMLFSGASVKCISVYTLSTVSMCFQHMDTKKIQKSLLDFMVKKHFI